MAGVAVMSMLETLRSPAAAHIAADARLHGEVISTPAANRSFAADAVTVPVEVGSVAGIAGVHGRGPGRSGRVAVLVVDVRVTVATIIVVTGSASVISEIGLAGYAVAVAIEVGCVTRIPFVERVDSGIARRVAVLVVDLFVRLVLGRGRRGGRRRR
jgi:hypothetical protein